MGIQALLLEDLFHGPGGQGCGYALPAQFLPYGEGASGRKADTISGEGTGEGLVIQQAPLLEPTDTGSDLPLSHPLFFETIP
jgi:hypothetical protein